MNVNETKHTEKLPDVVFTSRVLRARTLIEASGKRFIWNAAIGEHVLSDRKTRSNKRAITSGGGKAVTMRSSNGTCSCDRRRSLTR